MYSKSEKLKLKRKKNLVLLVIILFVAAACNKTPSMVINGNKINIEIAQTSSERAIGLSNRDFLEQNSGMLFIFDQADRHSFWMKDMKFSLDFIWIHDGKVIEITPNVNFIDQSTIYQPGEAVDSMLEVNAGFAAKKGIKIGDKAVVDQ